MSFQSSMSFQSYKHPRFQELYIVGALLLLTVAIGSILRGPWALVGWSFEGLALIIMWTWVDHPGLKWSALAILSYVAIRLFTFWEVVAHLDRGWIAFLPVLVWYVVAFAALMGAHICLAPLEATRLRNWERRFYRLLGFPKIGAFGSLVGGVLVLFIGLNLVVLNAFSATPNIAINFSDPSVRYTIEGYFNPLAISRDVAVSGAWTLFGLLTLVAGLVFKLRILSVCGLGFFLVAVAKVAIIDLANLSGLPRAMSWVGLAAAFILVSLAFRRIVAPLIVH